MNRMARISALSTSTNGRRAIWRLDESEAPVTQLEVKTEGYELQTG